MPRINPAYVDLIKVLIRDAAYPSHMSMTLEALEIGSCRVQLPVRPEHWHRARQHRGSARDRSNIE